MLVLSDKPRLAHSSKLHFPTSADRVCLISQDNIAVPRAGRWLPNAIIEEQISMAAATELNRFHTRAYPGLEISVLKNC